MRADGRSPSRPSAKRESPDSRSSRIAGSLVRAILQLYPAEDRARYGDDIVRTCLRRLREHSDVGGARGAVRVVRELGVLLRSALAERFRTLSERRAGAGRRAVFVRPDPRDGTTVFPDRHEAMMSFLDDLRHGVRSLRSRPLFTFAIVATLALGIGATSTLYSLTREALLRPLPYPDPDRIVSVWSTHEGTETDFGDSSWPNVADLGERATVFSRFAAYGGRTATLLLPDRAERVRGARVTADFFALLGITPAAGRGLQAGDFAEAAEPVVVLSARLAQTAFGAEPAVGRTVDLNGLQRTIVGVLPPEFHFAPAGQREFWIPLELRDVERDNRRRRFVHPFGRLRDDVTITQAQAEIDALADGLATEFPVANEDRGFRLIGLRDRIVGAAGPALLALLGSVGFILLITCANVAGLLLARAADRQREMAVRAALGAGRARLARQVLAESCCLAVIGGVGGLALAAWLLRVVQGAIPAEVATASPFLVSARLDAGVTAFTIAVALGTGILFGLVPALRASGGDVSALNSARTVADTAGGLRAMLLAAQVAIAVVLLVGAGLTVRSTARLLQRDPGFDRDTVLTMQILVPGAQYPEAPAVAELYRTLLAEVERLPNVASAGLINKIPVGDRGNTSGIVDVDNPPAEGQEPSARMRDVTPDAFRALGIPVLAGRGFDETDDTAGAPVVILNETFALQLFGDRGAVGRTIAFAWDRDFRAEIVGVVGDATLGAPDEGPTPVVYTSSYQSPSWGGAIVVRTTGRPETSAESVRSAIRSVDATLPIFAVRTLDDIVTSAPEILLRRYPAMLMSAFGGLALVLVAVGLYGVLSYSLSRRTREIGLRVAIGARAVDVARTVLLRSLAIAAAGLVAGTIAAIALSGLLSNMLYEVEPTDPTTLVGVIGILGGITLLASLVPTRRALRVSPMEALRDD